MKHIFVVNPAAGDGEGEAAVRAGLSAVEGIDYELYITKGERDGERFVRSRIGEGGDELRFYACGGDGTLNEVVSGAAFAPGVSVACYPCGSGNDFVKYYGGTAAFLDLPALVRAESVPIDLIRVGDRVAVNACHFGFDSRVAYLHSRLKAAVGGKNAYPLAVANALITAMKNDCRVWADGELLGGGERMLLCTVANGSHVGGSYKCAPRSLDNDGWLEVCYVKSISRLRFVKMMGLYQQGLHLDSPSFADCMIYRRAKTVKVEAADGFRYSLDGEVYPGSRFTAQVEPGALNFAVPEGAAPNPGVPAPAEATA